MNSIGIFLYALKLVIFFIAVSTIKAISDLTWKYLLPYSRSNV